MGGQERRNRPGCYPNQRQAHRFPDHHQLYPRLACAKRHANTKLLGLLRHRIGDNSINPQRSQNQPQHSKHAYQQNEEPARRNRMIHQSLNGTKLCRRLRGRRERDTIPIPRLAAAPKGQHSHVVETWDAVGKRPHVVKAGIYQLGRLPPSLLVHQGHHAVHAVFPTLVAGF
jgi:hypothetical protein